MAARRSAVEDRIDTDDPPLSRSDDRTGKQQPSGKGTTISQLASAIDLYWLPLGAGGHFVRTNGRLYEALVSRLERRPAFDLYHSALEVRLRSARWVIESAPIRDGNGADRGVVGEGPVGARWAGRFRLFRYELRVWTGGRIPDIDEAVESPHRLSTRSADAERLLGLAPLVPKPTWGRDELGTGEMWNSNSFIAWLLVAGGHDVDSLRPPAGGRAPGWNAGVVVARRAQSGISRNRSG